MGVIDERPEELLFVGIGINAPDDGDVHLDILGRDRQQAVAIAVAAAVVIQRKDAGRTGDIPLPFQLSLVHLFLFGDLHHQLRKDGTVGLAVARPVLIAQADTGDAVDEDESVGVQFTGSLQLLVALTGPEESQLLNIIQPAHLAGQLHYRDRRTQGRQLRPHQGLVGHHMAVVSRDDGLEAVVHPPLPDELFKVAALLHRIDTGAVALHVELPYLALGGVLDFIHCKVRIFLEGVEVQCVLRIPCHAAGHPDAQSLAVRQSSTALGKVLFQLFDVRPQGLPRLIAVEQQQELVAGKAGHHSAAGRALL